MATPLFGEALRFVDRRLRDERWLCWGAAFALLSTHALLDGFTTYGTKLLWPLFTEPISWSSIFIIDPLYTLPLLVALLVSLFARPSPGPSPLGGLARRAASWGLILSTAYLGWTLAARELAWTRVLDSLEAGGFRHERLVMIPMPFNSLLWRGLAVDGDRYANVYVSLFDEGPAALHEHPRNLALAAALPDRRPVERIAWFSHGFYAFERRGGSILLRDLRVGVEPDYVLTFEVARYRSETAAMVPPERPPVRRDFSQLGWLWQRIFDETAIRDERRRD